MLFCFIQMIYLLATILSSTSIYIIFSLAKNYSCRLSDIITLNYLIATCLGLGLFIKTDSDILISPKPWLLFAFILGSLFIGMFFLIGNSSQKVGITITTLANKLSMVFPVLFSLIWFAEEISLLKYFGLFTALVAIFLTIYKPRAKTANSKYIILPIAIFIGSGVTDSVVKYVQAVKISDSESAIFSAFVFMVAFFFSTTISILNIKTSKPKSFYPTAIFGISLGLVNFGSLYFLIQSLNNSHLKSSLVFAIVNISIVLLSALYGKLFFKEKLSKMNFAGIVLAVISLYFLV